MANRNYKTRDVMQKRINIELGKPKCGVGMGADFAADHLTRKAGAHLLLNRKRTRAVEKREAIIEHS